MLATNEDQVAENNKEEDHKDIENEDGTLDDGDDASKSTYLDETTVNMENIGKVSHDNVNNNFDNSGSKESSSEFEKVQGTDKEAPDEYNSQYEMPNIDGAPTESNLETLDIDAKHSESFDESVQMLDHTEAKIDENEQGSLDMEVNYSENPNEYDFVDGNENIDQPEKEESNKEIQDSIKSNDEGSMLEEKPLDASSSNEEASPTRTNKEGPTKTENSQTPDNGFVDDINVDKKDTKRQSETKSDSLNGGEDNDIFLNLNFIQSPFFQIIIKIMVVNNCYKMVFILADSCLWCP